MVVDAKSVLKKAVVIRFRMRLVSSAVFGQLLQIVNEMGRRPEGVPIVTISINFTVSGRQESGQLCSKTDAVPEADLVLVICKNGHPRCRQQ